MPFTTSTLQQDANSRLGLTSAQTMKVCMRFVSSSAAGDSPLSGHVITSCQPLTNLFAVCLAGQVAQELYEEGFISYMRTDSPNMGSDALRVAQKQALELYGQNDALVGPSGCWRSNRQTYTA